MLSAWVNMLTGVKSSINTNENTPEKPLEISQMNGIDVSIRNPLAHHWQLPHSTPCFSANASLAPVTSASAGG